MALTTSIQLLINTYVRNYAEPAFHDMNLNRILLLMCQALDGISGGVIINPPASAVTVTAANFTGSPAVNCALPQLVGQNLSILWGDVPKLLIQGTDFNLYAGGGFTMLTPGFDATVNPGNMTVWTIS